MTSNTRSDSTQLPARLPAGLAAGLAFASAATTAYWLFGGTALLDTVGGYAEDLARSRSPRALVLGVVVVGVKVVAGLLAVALARPVGRLRVRRLLRLAGALGAALLIAYGGLLVVAGALVLSGALEPDGPVDRRVLGWHVGLWDLWFLLWGVALAVATWQSGRPPRTR